MENHERQGKQNNIPLFHILLMLLDGLNIYLCLKSLNKGTYSNAKTILECTLLGSIPRFIERAYMQVLFRCKFGR